MGKQTLFKIYAALKFFINYILIFAIDLKYIIFTISLRYLLSFISLY